nr:putative plastid-lipid-associated protein 13, chloroplastic [Tanacetum cinerariifolium]
MSSKCNNIKLVIRNANSEVVCPMCKQCLITVNHDVYVLNYVNGMNSHGKKQKANVSNQKKHKAQVSKPKNVGSKERLASPKPSTPRSCRRWSPTGRLFNLKGKIITNSESECQPDCFKDNRMNEKADANSIEPNANMDGKKDFTQQKNNNFKKVYHYWVCGKPGHKAKDYRHKKEYRGRNSKGNSNQANHVESPKEFVGVIESFLTTNVVNWWLDTGAIKDICNSRGMFVSYKKNSVAYRFLVYKSNVECISNNTIIKSAEANFFEKIFHYKDKEKQILNPRKRVMNDQLSQDETDNNYEVPQKNVEPRLSKRAKVTKDFGPDCMTYIMNEEPKIYKASMESSESPYWKEAIQSGIDSIVQNNTWKLFDLPSRHKPIGHKWIFKKKLKLDDDMLIMGTNMDVINQTKKMLHFSFNMKDIEEADVILGIRIQKNSNGYILTQSHYIEKTLRKFRHYDDRPVVNPFDPKISNQNEGKSTSVYVFTLEGAVVSWKSSKQTMNTRSTMEAEFVTLDEAAKEAEWLRSFLEGIPLWPKLVTAVCIHCDSMAALTRAKNQIYNGKSRHKRRCNNTIKDLLRNEIISIDYVKSKENIVNPLTKGLCREQVIFTSRGMGLKRTQ